MSPTTSRAAVARLEAVDAFLQRAADELAYREGGTEVPLWPGAPERVAIHSDTPHADLAEGAGNVMAEAFDVLTAAEAEGDTWAAYVARGAALTADHVYRRHGRRGCAELLRLATCAHRAGDDPTDRVDRWRVLRAELAGWSAARLAGAEAHARNASDEESATVMDDAFRSAHAEAWSMPLPWEPFADGEAQPW